MVAGDDASSPQSEAVGNAGKGMGKAMRGRM